MKTVKKISTLILAIVFTFALSINTFAATVADGDYPIECKMEGGTHDRAVTSATLHVINGVMTADIVTDSKHYTWLKINDVQLDNTALIELEYSSFEGIPVSELDIPLGVTMETTAMSKPYPIDYTLTFVSSSLPEGAIIADVVEPEAQEGSSTDESNNNNTEETAAANTSEATTEAQSFVIKGEITTDGDKMTVVSANGKTYVIENGKLFEKNESGELVELTDNLANVSLFDANNNKLTLKDGKFVSDTDKLDDNSVKTTAAKADDTKKISPAPIVITVVIIAAAVVVCVVLVLKKKKSATTADGLTNDVNSSDNDEE